VAACVVQPHAARLGNLPPCVPSHDGGTIIRQRDEVVKQDASENFGTDWQTSVCLVHSTPLARFTQRASTAAGPGNSRQ
jgi:hypothetical protein